MAKKLPYVPLALGAGVVALLVLSRSKSTPSQRPPPPPFTGPGVPPPVTAPSTPPGAPPPSGLPIPPGAVTIPPAPSTSHIPRPARPGTFTDVFGPRQQLIAKYNTLISEGTLHPERANTTEMLTFSEVLRISGFVNEAAALKNLADQILASREPPGGPIAPPPSTIAGYAPFGRRRG